jgi:hypothetical protein
MAALCLLILTDAKENLCIGSSLRGYICIHLPRGTVERLSGEAKGIHLPPNIQEYSVKPGGGVVGGARGCRVGVGVAAKLLELDTLVHPSISSSASMMSCLADTFSGSSPMWSSQWSFTGDSSQIGETSETVSISRRSAEDQDSEIFVRVEPLWEVPLVSSCEFLPIVLADGEFRVKLNNILAVHQFGGIR